MLDFNGMSSEMTIFDKIIRGDVPSHKLYEDDHVFAFLDISPLSKGHALVVPKESKAYLHELSEETGAAIGRCLPRLARAIMETTGATAYNVLQNNGRMAHQAVFHVHFHIIPRYEDEGLGIVWHPKSLSDEEGSRLAESVRAALGEGSTG